MNLKEVRQEIDKTGLRAIDKNGEAVKINPDLIVTRKGNIVTMLGGDVFTVIEEGNA